MLGATELTENVSGWVKKNDQKFKGRRFRDERSKFTRHYLPFSKSFFSSIFEREKVVLERSRFFLCCRFSTESITRITNFTENANFAKSLTNFLVTTMRTQDVVKRQIISDPQREMRSNNPTFVCNNDNALFVQFLRYRHTSSYSQKVTKTYR